MQGGSVITHDWDLTQRRFERTVAPGSGVSQAATQEILEFDHLGQPTSATTMRGANLSDLMGTVNLTWDGFGRKLQESFMYLGVDTNHPVEIDSGYQAAQPHGDPSSRRSLTDSSGFQIGSTPDAIGRLSRRTPQEPGADKPYTLATYTWDGGVARQRDTQVGGTATMRRSVSLDSYRRVQGIDHQLLGAQTPFEARSLEWTPGGELLKRAWAKVDSSEGDQFDYDGYHRLVGAKLGVADISQKRSPMRFIAVCFVLFLGLPFNGGSVAAQESADAHGSAGTHLLPMGDDCLVFAVLDGKLCVERWSVAGSDSGRVDPAADKVSQVSELRLNAHLSRLFGAAKTGPDTVAVLGARGRKGRAVVMTLDLNKWSISETVDLPNGGGALISGTLRWMGNGREVAAGCLFYEGPTEAAVALYESSSERLIQLGVVRVASGSEERPTIPSIQSLRAGTDGAGVAWIDNTKGFISCSISRPGRPPRVWRRDEVGGMSLDLRAGSTLAVCVDSDGDRVEDLLLAVPGSISRKGVGSIGLIALLSGETGELIWCAGPPYETAWESSFGRVLAASSASRAAYSSGRIPGNGDVDMYQYTWPNGDLEASLVWTVSGVDNANDLVAAVGETRLWVLIDGEQAYDVRCLPLVDMGR